MRNGNSSREVQRRLEPAIEAIDAWLATLPGTRHRLTDLELRAYRSVGPVAGWRIEATFGDLTRSLDILLDDRFPRSQPRIALSETSANERLPHVSEEGVLCLLPDMSGTNSFEPVLVVKNVLSAAAGLLEEIFAGKCEGDFREEFNAYWGLGCTDLGLSIRSLLEVCPPSRHIEVWRGVQQYVAGEDAAQVLNWLANFAQDGKSDRKADKALFLWIDAPLIPSQYPQNGHDVLELARRCGAERLFRDLVGDGEKEVVVLLGSTTIHGPCLAAVHVIPPNNKRFGRRSESMVHRGFRPGKIPKELFQNRFINESALARRIVDRVDPGWIHGRDIDERAKLLQGQSVGVLGCGSIGAPVALLLARAGVGNLRLIDPQKMGWPNIGRHPLGAASVDQFKAEELSRRILRELPHVQSVLPFSKRWEEVLSARPEVLEQCDLIISTMGDWAAEGGLNEWHLHRGRIKPIVYGWTEAEAVAGHSIAIVRNGGCLQCGFGDCGQPLLTVAEWQASTLRHEPGCGAVFQPYGPIEVANVVSLVAELSLDVLLGQISSCTHRVWVAGKNRLVAAGGRWTEEWMELVGPPRHCPFVEERPWQVSKSCRECAHHLATTSVIQASA